MQNSTLHQKSIEVMFAESLAYWMEKKEFHAQAALAKKAGLDQKTISNCLNPAQRAVTATGRDKTPSLGTVGRLASALGIPAWVLLRPISAQNDAEYASAKSSLYLTK